MFDKTNFYFPNTNICKRSKVFELERVRKVRLASPSFILLKRNFRGIYFVQSPYISLVILGFPSPIQMFCFRSHTEANFWYCAKAQISMTTLTFPLEVRTYSIRFHIPWKSQLRIFTISMVISTNSSFSSTNYALLGSAQFYR